MFLGIDLGTTSLKVVLVNENLQCIANESVALTVSRPKPLMSEQNPYDWWNALNVAMHHLRENHSESMKKVLAIGLSGQMHGAVLLDKAEEVLRPAILWNDGRSSEGCSEIKRALPTVEKLIGCQVMPGFTAPKILWVKKYEPDIYKKIKKVLLPKDYLRFKMTDDFATDLSDASGTAWLDIKNRDWSDDLLSACNLTTDHMPQLFEGNAVTGHIKNELAKDWGLSDKVKIVAGAGDNAASAMSMGKVDSHVAYLSLGTSATFFVACDAYHPNSKSGVHTYCHAVPNTWHHMTVHLNGASCIGWLAKLLKKDIAELLVDVEKQRKETPLIFLPYLSGERTPYNNPHASGVFFGLNHTTDQVAMTQAVLEGSAFGLMQGYEALLQDPNVSINEITVVGGGAKNNYWGEILASILQKPLTYRQRGEVGAAFGAAKLAWMAQTKQDVVMSDEQIVERVIQPNEKLMSQLEKKHQLFQNLYQHVEQDFNYLYQ